jgi:hypothetical protein
MVLSERLGVRADGEYPGRAKVVTVFLTLACNALRIDEAKNRPIIIDSR